MRLLRSDVWAALLAKGLDNRQGYVIIAYMRARHVLPSSSFPVVLSLGLWCAMALAGVGPLAADPFVLTDVPAGDLLRFDLGTGDSTLIGSLGLPGEVGTLAFLPTGELLAVDLVVTQLLQIDPLTGQGTVIGPLGLQAGLYFHGMTADACGRLWMLASADGVERPDLYRIDPEDGTAELRASLPEAVWGLAAADETLYTLAEDRDEPWIVKVDPLSGELTDVAAVTGFHDTFHSLALDFDASGALLDSGYYSPTPLPPPQARAHRVGLDGTATGLGLDGGSPLFNLAFGPPPGECRSLSLSVPTASPLGLAVLAIAVAWAGSLLLGRRRSSR